jgi:hypothetical protein
VASPSFGDTAFLVQSDQPSGSSSPLPDGSTDKTTFTVNGAELDVTFIDKGGDGPSGGVPDTAATLPLLGLSLAGLGILRKRLNR